MYDFNWIASPLFSLCKSWRLNVFLFWLDIRQVSLSLGTMLLVYMQNAMRCCCHAVTSKSYFCKNLLQSSSVVVHSSQYCIFLRVLLFNSILHCYLWKVILISGSWYLKRHHLYKLPIWIAKYDIKTYTSLKNAGTWNYQNAIKRVKVLFSVCELFIFWPSTCPIIWHGCSCNVMACNVLLFFFSLICASLESEQMEVLYVM